MTTDGTLQLLLADALEPDEALELTRRLAREPALRRRLSQMKSATYDLPSPDPWRIPPPALAPQGRVVGAPVLGPPHLRPGEVCRVLLPAPTDPEAREVMLLWRAPEGAWQVIAPAQAEERVPADQLDREGDQLCIDFTTRPPPGLQTWAVALPEAHLLDHIDFAAPDWGPVQAAIQSGRIPLTALDILIEP